MAHVSSATSNNLDLSNCEKEPIHIPGHIQDCGLLLAVDPVSLIIRQVSSNTAKLFNMPAEQLLDQNLDVLLSADNLKEIADISPDLLNSNPLFVGTVQLRDMGLYNMIAHTYQGVLLLEFEAALRGTPAIADFHQIIRAAVNRLKGTSGLSEFAQMVAREVYRISGFDRVMVYQFQNDLSGKVIAEELNPMVNRESFLDLRYPASDIPAQARRLFLDNIVRVIPEISYTPVLMVPELYPDTDQPLDMTYAFLRGVSPIHVEYLANMGVEASLTLALEREGELWGLIACHHYSPRKVDYTTRTACEFLAHSVSLQLTNKEDQEYAAYQKDSDAAQTAIIKRLADSGNLLYGFEMDGEGALTQLIHCDGVVVAAGDTVIGSGTIPDDNAAKELVAWLKSEDRLSDNLYFTDNLLAASGGLFGRDGRQAGVLALSLGVTGMIIWFRAEQVQQVTWAGNPEKPVDTSADGARLSPRKSFEAWTEKVRNQSQPWLDVEIKAIRHLELLIKEVVVRKAEELERLNEQLNRSNEELNNFAYITSHDLKEPLRGIHNYSQFLMEDYGHLLDPKGLERLTTLGTLSQRMESLLDSLLYYSRAGRVELAVADTDLTAVVNDAIAMLQYPIEEKNALINIPRPFPVLNVDRIRVGEVFLNLISNALKYCDEAQPEVEIGWYADENADEFVPVFYVKDNGIGIKERNYEAVFRIFKRLHGRHKYGGGTGAGLAITKKIIERHQGKIWLESLPGKGTTFYFTLTAGPVHQKGERT